MEGRAGTEVMEGKDGHKHRVIRSNVKNLWRNARIHGGTIFIIHKNSEAGTRKQTWRKHLTIEI